MTGGRDIGWPAPGVVRRTLRALLALLMAAVAGAALIALLAQIPARHQVDVGGYDAAYVQGFYDAEGTDSPGVPAPYLAGSDGSARWTRPDSSALLFPQAGLPGTVRLRLRGWRPTGPPPRVSVLLNGADLLGEFQASGSWEELSFPVRSGIYKASDFFVDLRATPAMTLSDGRSVGVLVDGASYEVAGLPVRPYPAQVAYGALVGAMIWLLVRTPSPPSPLSRSGRGGWGVRAGRQSSLTLLAIALYGLAWLLLYHNQPPLYPYPLRALPGAVCLGLAGLLVLRYGPGLVARVPTVLGVLLPVGVIGLWTAATLLAAQGHLTEIRPGVENDFRVFATRETLGQVLSADGFYNLGYPLLLWLIRPLYAGNAFLAGRMLAALSGAVFLAGGYWLARALLPPGPALLALVTLALSGFVAQYGLYVGSDMPFAACVCVCVAAGVGGRGLGVGGRGSGILFFAGVFGGAAFLMRHLGVVLLPWGILVWLVAGWRDGGRRAAALFAVGFLLVAAPQIVINTVQAGSPLYNQQAKNIWLAVYGGTDWGRWDEAPNGVSLTNVVLRDPARFLGNWWRNVVGYVGSGAEDTSEFGRADQLRLIGWPANWLGVGGLLAWAVLAFHVAYRPSPPAPLPHGERGGRSRVVAESPPSPAQGEGGWGGEGERRSRELLKLALIALILIYVAAVSTAFTLQRFFLPLAPIYAVAAAWVVWRLTGGGRALLGVGLALVVVLWGGWAGGVRYALAGQPADEVAAAQMVEANLPAGALFGARVSARLPLAKYSAIAHAAVNWPTGGDLAQTISAADLDALRAIGASYLLWDDALGLPPLVDPTGARVADSGRYSLFRLEP